MPGIDPDSPGGVHLVRSHHHVAAHTWRDYRAVFAAALVSFGAAGPALAAGHYTLAWWRQLGNYENGAGAGCTGNHVINVWVFDEAGAPRPGVQLKTTWGVLLGTTDVDGLSQIILDNANVRYDFVCTDASGATSDIALEMSSRLRPCWGHYSFEVGFLYKADAANPGSFDTSLHCTLNPGCPDYGNCPETFDAPYSKSLAFNSINCADYRSDEFVLGNWQSAASYFGQTFVATGNRVVAMRGHGTIGGNNTLEFKAQIVTWPGLQPVGPAKSTSVRFPFGRVITWGVNEVPVVPGQTYMLKIWRDGTGMNSYRVVRNNYAAGHYFEGTTAYPDFELEGWVCCMDYGANIQITAGPAVVERTETSATIAWTTDVPADSRVDYGPTATYGQSVFDPALVTQHRVTLSNLTAHSRYHFQITSAASGYISVTSGDHVFDLAARGDFDRDGDVDIDDFGHMQRCITGPGAVQDDAECANANLDQDLDVDQDDVNLFQVCLSGPNRRPEPVCFP